MYTQQTVINDALNLLRGKLVRFILEDGDMRMIANLVAAADELGLEYDPEGMVYRMPEQQKKGMTRQQLAKELEPGLNALFGAEYSRIELTEEERAELYALKKKRGRPKKNPETPTVKRKRGRPRKDAK